MDKVISIIVGFFGSVIAGFFGGWTYAFQVLIILMAIDYVSGLVVAGVFKKSKKTKKSIDWMNILQMILQASPIYNCSPMTILMMTILNCSILTNSKSIHSISIL